MVFNRKPDPTSNEPALPIMRSNERASAAHLSQVPSSGLPRSVIGNDFTIEGQTITIRCKGSLTVNGNLQADLHARELEVGREAQINGAISADTINVFGRVSGAILGARVILHSGAEVDGDIHSHTLAIEQGACFDGSSRKVRDLSEVAPQVERPDNAATPLTSYGTSPPTATSPFGKTSSLGSLLGS